MPKVQPLNKLMYRTTCIECGDDRWLTDRAVEVPHICPECWFWYQFAASVGHLIIPIVCDGVLYGLDMRDRAEGVGPMCTVRYFDGHEIHTMRVRVIDEVPVGTPDTAIVQRA